MSSGAIFMTKAVWHHNGPLTDSASLRAFVGKVVVSQVDLV